MQLVFPEWYKWVGHLLLDQFCELIQGVGAALDDASVDLHAHRIYAHIINVVSLVENHTGLTGHFFGDDLCDLWI